jgi:hypothetical protein
MNTLKTLLTAAVTTATLSLVAGTVSAAARLALGADGQLFTIDSATQKVTATVAGLPGNIIVIAVLPAMSSRGFRQRGGRPLGLPPVLSWRRFPRTNHPWP